MQIIKPVTLGKRLKNIRTESFILTESLYSPSFSTSRHDHEHTSLSFVLQGSFAEVFGKSAYDCDSSSLLIKPAGEAHSNKYGTAGATTLIIEVKHDRLKALSRYTNILNNISCLRGELVNIYMRRISREFHLHDTASSLAIEGLLFEMFASLGRSRCGKFSRRPPTLKLRQARDFIHDQFNLPISLSDVAEAVGIHSTYLSRLFREHYRCSVGEYLRQVRLRHALELLCETDKAFTEIALETGFYDHSHFCHAFKSYFRLSPTEYRRSQKKHKAGTGKL